MLDVVVNHFAWPGNGTTVDYSNFNPFNKEEYFHPFHLLSDLNANNKTDAEIGWLGDDVLSLPDVKTEDPQVASMYYSWIKSLVSNYSADGVRIDTVLNVNTDFFPGFNKAAGVFCTGEVFNGDPASSCPIQEDLDSILNFPMYMNCVNSVWEIAAYLLQLFLPNTRLQLNEREHYRTRGSNAGRKEQL